MQLSSAPPQPRPHLISLNLRVLCNARRKLKSIQNIVNIAILPRFLSRFSPFELPAEEANTVPYNWQQYILYFQQVLASQSQSAHPDSSVDVV